MSTLNLKYNWYFTKDRIFNEKKWHETACKILKIDRETLQYQLLKFFTMIERTNSYPRFPKDIKPRFVDWYLKESKNNEHVKNIN